MLRVQVPLLPMLTLWCLSADPAPAVGQQKAEELFRSGFHMCAKEMLQYMASWETEGDLTPANMINHLHQLATEVLLRLTD